MNKTELFAAVAAKCEGDGVAKGVGDKRAQAVIDVITETLAKGEDVAILGFGTFTTVKKAESTARNPKTGEVMKVAAKTSPKFKPGTALKNAVNK